MIPVYGLVHLLVGPVISGFHIPRPEWTNVWLPVVVSPLLEEPLKAVGPARRWILDGAPTAHPWRMGALVGLGFGLVELIGYVSSAPPILGPGFQEKVLVFRLAFAIPLHMLTSALAVGALAATWKRRPVAWFVFLALLPAILIHAGYNAIVLALPSGTLG